MSERETAVVILAAGLGTRMKSARPKVLHPLAGRPMIAHLVAALEELAPARTVVVVGAAMDEVADAVPGATVVRQEPPLGTGHAVMAAGAALEGFSGEVLILFGDSPLVRPETLRAMLDARAREPEPAVVVMGFRPADPAEYGRLVVAGDGTLEAIVEARDASPEERAIGLCNAGTMAVDGAALFDLLDGLGRDNAKGEYYLTDIVAAARRRGLRCAVVEGAPEEALGINSRADLAAAEVVIQARLREVVMEAGVTLIDPETIYLCHDTRIGRDSVVGPYVFFGPGVTLGEAVTVKPFCHLEGARVESGAMVGPFARLRPGARIEGRARIGNFVEVKQAVIEAGAKVNHLSYIGDARVGAEANVGAGTITCNYDGFQKSFTDIGAGAFIGSNTALVAPVKVGDGAIIGAGSVISRDVAADALAVTRAKQIERAGWAAKWRRRMSAAKGGKKTGEG
jgi:bifunctional UDP-N-acetylglucosamine pyrophosphorylase/glucosamine-1-phosphate N-acetyltransferase